MFDLFRSRQKAVRYLLGAILGVIALTMVITLIPGVGTPTTKTDDPVIADIGGTPLTAQQVLIQTANTQNLPPEMLEVYLPQVVDNMVQQRALLYEFGKMGLTVSDDEVYTAMTVYFPQFFKNGVLTDKAQLEAALGQQGQTIQDAIDNVRQQLLMLKIQNIEFESTVVTPKEVDDAIAQKFDKAKVKYVAFLPAKFHDLAKVTPEEIKASFEAHRNDYTMPEKRSFVVVVLDQDKVAESINISDAQLHAAYSANMDNFRTPERVHVRHILVMTQGKPDADKPKLLAKAQDLLKQVKSGGDFAAIAAKNSDDTSNAPKGGDLDWKVRGELVPEFEKVAFALQPKQISDIVTTPYGYHIIQSIDKQPARVKPFEEVKTSLTEELRKQGLAEKMQTLGDQIRAALEKSPGSAVEIAKQFGANPVVVTNADLNSPIPTLGVSPEIDSALAGLKKDGVSQVLALPANRVAVVVLTDRAPVRFAELSEVESKVREALIDQKAGGISTEKAKEAAARIRAGEDMAKVAKSFNLSVTESIEFTHADSVEGLGGAAQIPDAFTKPIGTVIGPINEPGRSNITGVPTNLVYQVVEQVHVDPANLTNERAAVLEQLKKIKANTGMQLLSDSVLARLMEEKKVTINKDAIKRMLAMVRR
jgi:peptidyl-prolyl cis-trans isomerase D